MVCDFTIAAHDAEVGEPEIQFQSSPPFLIMPWVVPMKLTKEPLLAGGRVNAETDYGAEMFVLTLMSEESEEKREFFAVGAEKGLKAAFKWRDERFALRK